MEKSLIRAIQTKLQELSFYAGAIDGLRGPITDGAALKGLEASATALPADWQNWSSKRHFIAYIQVLATEMGIESGQIDGRWGPQTEFAASQLEAKLTTGVLPPPWRDIVPLEANPNAWPTQADVSSFFGPHGEPDGSFSPPIVRVECPWQLKIAWNLNQKTSSISIHEKCADSLGRVLAKIHSVYGSAEISRLRLDYYGGSYMPRSMRGGTRWSMHSWAIAIDWDPANNRLNWNREQASLDDTIYDDWWKAWEEEGWLSLGRARNFDWMHVQAAKL